MIENGRWRSIVLLGLFIIISQRVGAGREAFGMEINQDPTVTVVDAETGAPIEGAVAIAIWRKKSVTKRAFWEGGTEIPVRIEEAVSDKEGEIYIDDFWDWKLFKNEKPHLTIYKPKYVCWDQEYIFPSWKKRKDFDEAHKVVKMEMWTDGYSYIDHDGFVGGVTHHEDGKAKEHLFLKAFLYEEPFYLREMHERHKRYKMLQEKKERR